ncbi:Uncharacterised protein [Flavonifractor plautii]|uniref:Uncharacterized protein n=1 Tax=Flavonifractor plautii TaxID=292800 RepID=A0A174ULN3_FLAPL|nr:Uncharacterised protein [Flavonifractor plautii]
MFSRPVRLSNSSKFWNRYPTFLPRYSARAFPLRAFSFVPAIIILPPLGGVTVAMQLSSVDLPEPLLPMMPRNSPGMT